MTFQPHSAEFGKLANAHAVLEAELKYYSSITSGVRPFVSHVLLLQSEAVVLFVYSSEGGQTRLRRGIANLSFLPLNLVICLVSPCRLCPHLDDDPHALQQQGLGPGCGRDTGPQRRPRARHPSTGASHYGVLWAKDLVLEVHGLGVMSIVWILRVSFEPSNRS